MKFLAALLAAAALNAPALAGPVTRADTVICEPRQDTETGKIKKFKVDVGVAEDQAKKAGLITGKSGDPHRYMNGDKINFGIHNCDKEGAILWEYPIYWVGKKAEWMKDEKTDRQPGGPTPIRVVYANNNGNIVYCGVMTHAVVKSNNQGEKFFLKCT
ncbi:hirsutellin A toxin [Metarhizium anisopliae]